MGNQARRASAERIAVAVSLLALVAGCGGGGSEGVSPSDTSAAASAAEAIGARALGGGSGGDVGRSDHGRDDSHGKGAGDHWDDDHDWHSGHQGKRHRHPKHKKKPPVLPQLPPAVAGTMPQTCEELAALLGSPVTAPIAPTAVGRASALSASGRVGTLVVGTPGSSPIPDTTFTSTGSVPAGTVVGGLPAGEHCVVAGEMLPRDSAVDGNGYSIKFEMRLPKDWNGRFWYQANGGIDGSVVPASGSFGGGPLTSALAQGFAVISSDAGHAGALGPFFGLDPQARLDYGYQAVGTLTPMAKQLIQIAYGKGPDRSYIGGCSNGGRHTLVAAARYADEYDGFLAGAPGYKLPLAALANIYGAQRYASIATGDPATPAGLATAFTPAERATVANAVLARCDALDGAVDGLVQDTDACQRRFSLFRHVPTCSGARDGSCLTLQQKIAIAPIFRGAALADGTRFYADFPYDSGLGGGGVAFWEFTAPLVLDSGAVGLIFGVPPADPATFNGPAFTLGANIDALHASLFATDSTYTESAMSFMTPPNATDMSAVRNRGAKILSYHGVSDAIFSVSDTVAWWEGVDDNSDGFGAQFARVFRVPGMGHCSGGPSTDQFDPITPLVAWVEQGIAPDRLTATARGAGNPGGANAELPAGWAADRTRPLCPYPRVARYRGFGDVEQASSFVCAAD